MAICEKCIKKSVCKLCDGSEIMGCIEFVGKGSNVLTTDQNEVKLLVGISKSLYEAAFEGRYTRYDSLNCIKAIRDGQILPDGCEILTKEAYADLCMRASKEPNCSEIPTGSTAKIDVPDNNVGNIDCISRADAIKAIQKYGVGCLDADDFSPEQCERFVINKLNELPSVTLKEPTTKYLEGVNKLAHFAISATGQSDPYFQGMCNGIEYMRATLTGTKPHFFEAESRVEK